MKSIQEIEKEFETYKTKTDFVNDSIDFDFYLKLTKEDIEDNKKIIYKELIGAKIAAGVSTFRKIFLFDAEEEPKLYLEDAKILENTLTMIDTFANYFDQIKEITEEENYMELLRLADFTAETFNEHYFYYEDRRDALEFAYRGYSYYNSKYDNYEEEFDDFFNDQIRKHKVRKAVEKLKKI